MLEDLAGLGVRELTATEQCEVLGGGFFEKVGRMFGKVFGEVAALAIDRICFLLGPMGT